jgi:2-methylcitrate dehydratase PrpD
VAGRFSIPFCASVYLTTGRVHPVSFNRQTLDDAGIRSLCQRVIVREGKDLPHPYSNQRSARVHVELTDGTQRSGYCANARGDYSNPLTDAELSEKFARVTMPVFGEASSRAAQAAWKFADAPDVKRFIAGLAQLT